MSTKRRALFSVLCSPVLGSRFSVLGSSCVFVDSLAVFWSQHRQTHGKGRPNANLAGHLDLAAVLGDDMRADRQAQAGALRLGGVERLEQVRVMLGRDADTGVGDLDDDGGGL